jgi:hypothetical protein
MRLVSKKIVLATGALAALTSFAAAEELTIVSTVSGGPRGGTKTSTQYLGATKVRTSDGENDTIMDVATGRITVIDHGKKEYYEFTREDMDAATRKMQESMKNLPPAFAEKMMGGALPDVKVEKTGAPRKVAGYDCETYVASMGEGFKYEVCTTTAIQPPAQYFDAMKGRYAMMGPMARRFEKMFDEMKKIKGFPIAMTSTVSMMGMKQETRSEATEIKKGPIAASAFEVPAGYKKKESPFSKMG